MTRAFLRRFLNTEEGAIAPLYALALFALVGAAGIAFDYSRLVAMDTELQNAADQAALAAATQLDTEDGARDRATDAASNLVANSTLFANETGGERLVSIEDVRFYATRADAESDENALDPNDDDLDAEATFVRVRTVLRTANYALTPVVGAISDEIRAEAVAGMGSALCRSPPVMICNPNEPSGGATPAAPGPDFDADAHRGDGLLVVQGGGGSWTSGNFGYLDTGGSNGAPGVREALGWISPPGNCVGQVGNETVVDTEPGNMANVTDALNTRFDIYNQQYCETGGSCPASINSVKDVMHPANFGANQACRLHNQGWQEVAAANRYKPTSATVPLATSITPAAMGHPRDMCHAVSTGTAGACTGPFGNGLWDRDAYFRSHYGWSATQWHENTPLGTDATRYEVYQWETYHQGQMIGGTTVLGSRPNGSLTGYGTPQCSSRKGYGSGTVPAENVADRRRISVAVVNCRTYGVRGNSTDVPVRRWMDVFLVQPSIDRSGGSRNTRKDEIYVEIIGETTSGSAGEVAGQVIRRDVPFLIR